MQIAQRTILVIELIVMVIFGVIFVSNRVTLRMQNQQEGIATERFLQSICRNGYISREAYEQYHKRLNYGSISSEIKIEEHREETDLSGESYYYLVTWEELMQSLSEENVYTFQQGSTIVIEINRRYQRKQVKNKYYGMITGKDRANVA